MLIAKGERMAKESLEGMRERLRDTLDALAWGIGVYAEMVRGRRA